MAKRMVIKRDSRIIIYDSLGNEFESGYEEELPEIAPAEDSPATLRQHGRAVGMRSTEFNFLNSSFTVQITDDELDETTSPWKAILTGDIALLPAGWVKFSTPHADRINLGVKFKMDMGTTYDYWDFGASSLKPAMAMADGKLKVDSMSVGSDTNIGYPGYSSVAK